MRVERAAANGFYLTAHGAEQDAPDPSLFDTLRAAAIQGKTALGPNAGRIDPPVGQGTQIASDFTRGKLSVNLEGFYLHAAVRVAECSLVESGVRTTFFAAP